MNWKDRPWMLYFIILLSIVVAGTLWRIHEGFSIDITIELLGAIITIIIIDELLLKSKRKRWNLVKNEVQYVLSRTINILRNDILRKMFFFSPKIEEKLDINTQEQLIRTQNDEEFNKLLALPTEEMLQIIKNGFLKQDYEDFFKEQAEDLWRIINTRYSEHLEPEVVEELLKLHLHLRDLHNSIRLYHREKDSNKKHFYQHLAEKNIVYNTKKIIQSLVHLKTLGYSQVSKRI